MGRGPSYPYVDLEAAVALTKKVYDFTKRSPAPLGSVIKDAWEYSATSSSGLKVLAALKAFGLVEEAASGDAKTLKITDRAYRILVDDPKSPERLGELREAALAPKWYKFCWDTWGLEMPQSMRSNLLFEHGFVESTVDAFLADYKKTIKYAGIDGPPLDASVAIDGKEKSTSFRIGSWVQWESQGVLRFTEPKKLQRLSEDGQFAFVEGSTTGIPVSQLIAAEEPEDGGNKERSREQPERKKRSMDTSVREDIFSLAEGDVTIQWPASISAESFQDIADWLPILERKIKRSVLKSEPEGQ